MARALGFYERTLGFRAARRASGLLKHLWAECALGSSRKQRVWFTQGVWQLTFLVKDVASCVEDLKKRGVRFQRLPTKLGGTRVTNEILELPKGRIAVFKDPEGNLCMLFEAKKPTRKRVARGAGRTTSKGRVLTPNRKSLKGLKRTPARRTRKKIV